VIFAQGGNGGANGGELDGEVEVTGIISFMLYQFSLAADVHPNDTLRVESLRHAQ